MSIDDFKMELHRDCQVHLPYIYILHLVGLFSTSLIVSQCSFYYPSSENIYTIINETFMRVQNDTSQIPFTLFHGDFLVELIKSNILMQLEHILVQNRDSLRINVVVLAMSFIYFLALTQM